LGRKHDLYIWLALGIIWLYALITGMHPPVIGGVIMASLFLTAELLGRQCTAITTLALGRRVVKATLGEDRAVASVANLITDSFSVTLGVLIAV
jgi:hypothetical protein